MRFARGSKRRLRCTSASSRRSLRRRRTVMRHHSHDTSGGSDPSASRHSHLLAAARPCSSRRRANSARRSSSTSSRSAIGTSARKIAATNNGRRGERRRGSAGISTMRSFYIVETGTTAKGFTAVIERSSPMISRGQEVGATLRMRTRRGRRRDRIGRVRPVHSRQVVQRDGRAPAIGSRPDYNAPQRDQHRHAQRRMRANDAEIDHDDHCGNRHAVADDVEGPRVTGIP